MSRIKKTSETRPLTGTILNVANNTDTNTYSCDYQNKAFGGTILWTNSSPTASFGAQNTNLSSSEFDEVEIIYYLTNYTGYDYRKTTGRIPYQQGKKIQVEMLDYDGNVGIVAYKRIITMTNKTSFSITDCEKIYNIGATTNNTYCIPLYIIGYKTSLF